MKSLLKWERVEVTKKQNWLLTGKEQEILKLVWNYLQKVGSCPITHIYKQVGMYVRGDSNIRLYTKYLLMFLWKINKVEIRCNDGLKLIKIKKLYRESK